MVGWGLLNYFLVQTDVRRSSLQPKQLLDYPAPRFMSAQRQVQQTDLPDGVCYQRPSGRGKHRRISYLRGKQWIIQKWYPQHKPRAVVTTEIQQSFTKSVTPSLKNRMGERAQCSTRHIAKESLVKVHFEKTYIM